MTLFIHQAYSTHQAHTVSVYRAAYRILLTIIGSLCRLKCKRPVGQVLLTAFDATPVFDQPTAIQIC